MEPRVVRSCLRRDVLPDAHEDVPHLQAGVIGQAARGDDRRDRGVGVIRAVQLNVEASGWSHPGRRRLLAQGDVADDRRHVGDRHRAMWVAVAAVVQANHAPIVTDDRTSRLGGRRLEGELEPSRTADHRRPDPGARLLRGDDRDRIPRDRLVTAPVVQQCERITLPDRRAELGHARRRVTRDAQHRDIPGQVKPDDLCAHRHAAVSDDVQLDRIDTRGGSVEPNQPNITGGDQTGPGVEMC